MYCLSTAKTVDNTRFLLESYKNTRTKKKATPFGVAFFLVLADKDSKRAAAKGRKKVFGGHFFSPGKSPIEHRLQVFTCKRCSIFFSLDGGLEPLQMQQSGGLLLPPVQTLVATIIFACGKNASKSGRYPQNILLT